MRRGKYNVAFNRETLEECLLTENPISSKVAHKLLSCGIYKFYAYDERIKARRYLLVDIGDNYGLPTWLHEYMG